MKKFLHPKFLPVLIAVAGMLGFLLRLWTLGSGPDKEMLYAPAPLAWTLLLILVAAVPVLIVLATRPLKQPLKYTQNFPASLISAVGCLLGALAMAMSGLQLFSGSPDIIQFLAAVAGVGSGLTLVAVALARLKGKQPNFLYHAVVCIFLALRIFHQCRSWSNQPQIGNFLFAFLSQICAMLATYQLCAFDVDMGDRRKSLFWSLSAAFLCLVELPSAENLLFTGCIAVWLLTNLCSLRPVKKRKPVPVEPEETVQVQVDGDVSIDELKSWLEEE